MATTYDNKNKGVLFENDRKETDRHPDMKGSININGTDHWFDAWWKEGARGRFLSLSIGKEKTHQPYATQAPKRTPPPAAPKASAPSSFDGLDDAPF